MGQGAYTTLDRLAEMTAGELQAGWVRRYAAPDTNLSPEVLRAAIAYRLQEQWLGGVSRSAKSLLRNLASLTPPRARTLWAGEDLPAHTGNSRT
jgi:hypothetical protein